MGSKTGIEWTRDDSGAAGKTWNPLVGCEHVSAGCDNCYAAREASGRLSRLPAYAGLAVGGRFTGKVRLLPERLDQPLRWRKPSRIFVNSMSDLFHHDVPDRYIAQMFAVMHDAEQHTFQVLTKRHARMRSLLRSDEFHGLVVGELAKLRAADQEYANPGLTWPLPNVWVGVSVETQQWADIRIPALLDTPAAVRFLSCEPLLGPLHLGMCDWTPAGAEGFPGVHNPLTGEWWPAVGNAAEEYGNRITDLPRIDWVIAGGESGPKARPMHPDWPRRIRDDCRHAGVPFFFKQWGEWSPLAPVDKDGRFDWSGAHPVADDGTVYKPGDLAYPDGPRYGEAVRADHGRAHLTNMYRVGKRKAGSELDGRTWDEFPKGAA